MSTKRNLCDIEQRVEMWGEKQYHNLHVGTFFSFVYNFLGRIFTQRLARIKTNKFFNNNNDKRDSYKKTKPCTALYINI